MVLVSCVPISSRWHPAIPSSCIDQTPFYEAALSTDVITDGILFTSRPGVGKVQSNDINLRSHTPTPYIQGAEITNATTTKAFRYWDFRAWYTSYNHRDHPVALRHSSRCSTCGLR